MTYGYTFSNPRIYRQFIWLMLESTLSLDVPGTSFKHINSYEYFLNACSLVPDMAYPYEVIRQCRNT